MLVAICFILNSSDRNVLSSTVYVYDINIPKWIAICWHLTRYSIPNVHCSNMDWYISTLINLQYLETDSNIIFGHAKVIPHHFLFWLHHRNWLPDVSVAYACGSWNPMDSNCWTLSCWAVILYSCSENNFDFETCWWINRKFSTQSPCRRSVSNCWTLDYWVVILSTRPWGVCCDKTFGTSWFTSFLAGTLDLKICTPHYTYTAAIHKCGSPVL